MNKLFKISACLMICVALTGCGSSNKNDNGVDSSNKNEKPTTNKVEKTSEEKIAEFVDQYKESVETSSNSIFDATLIARGKSIVYSYTYKTVYTSEQTEAMKPTLEKGIDSNKNVFTDLLTTLKTVAPDAEAVVIEFYNGDNSLITSIEYK